MKASNGSSGFISYTTKDGSERQAHFHVSDVTEKLQLKPGDEVAFHLSFTHNQKSKLPSARNVLRTKVNRR